MRFSLTSLVRPMVILALGVSAVAIVLGRFGPHSLRMRSLTAPRYESINGVVFSLDATTPVFLDRETGALTRFHLPQGDRVEYARCSPWRDERNESQVVGRWTHRPVQWGRGRCGDVGLARYSIPSGRVIDRVPLDVMPSGTLCWFPGTAARVLFAGGDGQLYQLAFEDPDDDLSWGAGEPPKAQPVHWKVDPPGERVLIKDLVWPIDPRLPRRVFVSLSYQMKKSGQPDFVPSQIWWLQLGEDGMTIEGAGRLTLPDPASSVEKTVEERLPNLAITPGGERVLAYLTSRNNSLDCQLRVVPVEVETGTGIPRVRTSGVSRIAESCVAVTPTFSLDGRWVYGIVRPHGATPRAMRFSVVDALANHPARQLARRADPFEAGTSTRSPDASERLNGAKIMLQLSGHLARRSELAREAGRHDPSRPVLRRAAGFHGDPVLDGVSDGGPRGRDSRGG